MQAGEVRNPTGVLPNIVAYVILVRRLDRARGRSGRCGVFNIQRILYVDCVVHLIHTAAMCNALFIPDLGRYSSNVLLC